MLRGAGECTMLRVHSAASGLLESAQCCNWVAGERYAEAFRSL